MPWHFHYGLEYHSIFHVNWLKAILPPYCLNLHNFLLQMEFLLLFLILIASWNFFSWKSNIELGFKHFFQILRVFIWVKILYNNMFVKFWYILWTYYGKQRAARIPSQNHAITGKNHNLSIKFMKNSQTVWSKKN